MPIPTSLSFHPISQTMAMKSPTVHLLLYMVALMAVMTVAELQRLEHPVKADGSLSFLVVGDWGRRGLYNQSNVAHQVLLFISITFHNSWLRVNFAPIYFL